MSNPFRGTCMVVTTDKWTRALWEGSLNPCAGVKVVPVNIISLKFMRKIINNVLVFSLDASLVSV
jgi:hypothetical protein